MVATHEVHCDASKELMKKMFNRIAYTLTALEYDVSMKELRAYNRPLTIWVQKNDP